MKQLGDKGRRRMMGREREKKERQREERVYISLVGRTGGKVRIKDGEEGGMRWKERRGEERTEEKKGLATALYFRP